jgi:hypothetical protein
MGKSAQVIFITHREMCPPVTLNSLRIPQAKDAKYLELYLDSRKNIYLPSESNLDFNWGKCTSYSASQLSITKQVVTVQGNSQIYLGL